MSKQPECKVCGDYINHGPVICEDCITQHDTAIAKAGQGAHVCMTPHPSKEALREGERG